MEYYRIEKKGNNFEAFHKDSCNDEDIELTENQMIPVSSLKTVYARIEDLREIIEKLFPKVEDKGIIANAFYPVKEEDYDFTQVIQFYKIPY